ncbi:hypothetical protein [Corynebacterium marinum]|uniref:Uncharacterized protein n=1 Tax=Corynebacterium marinum DSM 44953 TaxID=1224162 RepID=A0A0B6TDB3_9CORY|nr:hypothetical protein [Corynebacterium marinum]AJK67907.1 hypothetical protein B840_01375 [Corynebacterium marinum DSM 44953]GGO11718.1 hypothetical protein GCM10010980_03400 [Corynebacterium marinum]
MATIGILADDGQPSRDVTRIVEDLLDDPRYDNEDDGTRTLTGTWPGVGEVEVRVETVPMSPDGDVMLSDHARQILQTRGWDRFIYVTDLPLTAWERPVVSQRARADAAVLISLPALGAFGTTRRLRRELISLVEEDRPVAGARRGGPDLVEGEDSDDSAGVETRVLDHRGRTMRMVFGMIRGNQPGRLLPVLSSSLAAMVATGGFGVFYGSIWKLAEEMSWSRLLLISTFAVVSFTAWLIIHNRLWQRSHTQETRWRERIDNLATIGTIGMTGLILYLLVMAVLFVSSAVVIPVGYLEAELEREVGLPTYASIAALSASLGAMAGALGSNFDRDVEIRSATYNLREYERRLQSGYYAGKGRTEG